MKLTTRKHSNHELHKIDIKLAQKKYTTHVLQGTTKRDKALANYMLKIYQSL